MGRINIRLILAVLSTMLTESAVVVAVLLGLPLVGIRIPLPLLVVLMAALLAYAVFSYRLGSRALRRKPTICLSPMIGSKGIVVSPLSPRGFIRIEGELWEATAVGESIAAGEEVTVVGQQGLKLTVSRSSACNSTQPE
ncbi:NfeD family protein [Chloroflexota bacterium]